MKEKYANENGKIDFTSCYRVGVKLLNFLNFSNPRETLFPPPTFLEIIILPGRSGKSLKYWKIIDDGACFALSCIIMPHQ